MGWSTPGPPQVWWSAGDRRYNAGSMQYMKTLSNPRDKNELLVRFANVRADSQPRWGAMSAHQMICHLSDSFRGSLGEKYISPATSVFKRTLLKWVALWVPLRWPHGVKTLPEMDQQQGGTQLSEFARNRKSALPAHLERPCSGANCICSVSPAFVPHT